MTIAHLISDRDDAIVSCSPRDSVHHAATLLAEKRIGALPVMEDGTVAGIFSERDLLYCVARDGAEVLHRAVGEVMTSPAITIEPGANVLKALSLMTKRRIRHLPVVEAGKVVGVVSIGDLVKAVIEEQQRELDHLQRYIAS